MMSFCKEQINNDIKVVSVNTERSHGDVGSFAVLIEDLMSVEEVNEQSHAESLAEVISVGGTGDLAASYIVKNFGAE